MTNRSSRRLGLQLPAVFVVLNVLADLWAVSTQYDEHAQQVRKAELTTQNLALVLDQNITAMIEKIDLARLGSVAWAD